MNILFTLALYHWAKQGPQKCEFWRIKKGQFGREKNVTLKLLLKEILMTEVFVKIGKEILMTEDFVKINPDDPLRLAKEET